MPLPSLTPTVGVPLTEVLKLTLLSLGVGSPVSGPTEAVSLMTVPGAVLLLTRTTRVKLAEVPASSEEVQADTVPPELPAAGALLVQSLGAVHDTSVVLAGSRSASVTLLWAVEPLLVTVSV